MWIFLNDAFLSIVSKDCARDELLVRARRKGDVEKIFPGARVVRNEEADYLFRAVVKRSEVAKALRGEVQRITYPNFKDSVADDALHNAYLRVWAAMLQLQPVRAFDSLFRRHIADDVDDMFDDAEPEPITNLVHRLKPGRK
jgi:hypothetical protein